MSASAAWLTSWGVWRRRHIFRFLVEWVAGLDHTTRLPLEARETDYVALTQRFFVALAVRTGCVVTQALVVLIPHRFPLEFDCARSPGEFLADLEGLLQSETRKELDQKERETQDEQKKKIAKIKQLEDELKIAKAKLKEALEETQKVKCLSCYVRVMIRTEVKEKQELQKQSDSAVKGKEKKQKEMEDIMKAKLKEALDEAEKVKKEKQELQKQSEDEAKEKEKKLKEMEDIMKGKEKKQQEMEDIMKAKLKEALEETQKVK
ncbi:unnamed protein product, partial [Effrenium voratum]